MFIASNRLFDRVLNEYSQIMPRFHNARKWHEMSENELWLELCLCILSSNVQFESAKSALQHLLRIGYLSSEWIVDTANSQQLIAQELQKPIYLPEKTDGSCRKYRFPNTRSKDICDAARVVSSRDNWLSRILADSSSEIETRNFLANNISGLGLKEASHFLRNIKYSEKLAIIDSHVLSFLMEINAIPKNCKKMITRKIYLDLETILKEICESYRLNLSVFDMAVWACMREG